MPPASVRMRKALHQLVIPALQEQGFRGQYPRFYREYSPYRIDIIEFFSLRGGGGFEVGATVIFPKMSLREDRNFYEMFENQIPVDISYGQTIIRHGIDGPFKGAFYYADVYECHYQVLDGDDCSVISESSYYMAVGEKRADTYQPQEGEILVQKADENTCTRVAEMVAEKLPALMTWFEQMQTPKDLKKWNKQDMKEMRRAVWRKKSAFYRWIEERFKHV